MMDSQWNTIQSVDLGGPIERPYRCGIIVSGMHPKPSAFRRSVYALRLFVLLNKRRPKRSRIRKKMMKASRLCWVNLTL